MSDSESETGCYYEEEYSSEEESETSPLNVYEEVDPLATIKKIILLITEHGINGKVMELVDDLEYQWTDYRYLAHLLENLENTYEESGYLTKNIDQYKLLVSLTRIKRIIKAILDE